MQLLPLVDAVSTILNTDREAVTIGLTSALSHASFAPCAPRGSSSLCPTPNKGLNIFIRRLCCTLVRFFEKVFSMFRMDTTNSTCRSLASSSFLTAAVAVPWVLSEKHKTANTRKDEYVSLGARSRGGSRHER